MDTEERIGIENTIGRGRPPADEILSHAPETRKISSAKAYRIVVCAGIGAVIGSAAAVTLVLTKLVVLPVAAPVVAAFTLTGLLYGWYHPDNIKKISRLLADSGTNAGRNGYFIEKSKEKIDLAPIITVVYPSDMPDFPASDTYPRDRLAGAKLALLNLDPSKTVRQ